MRKLQQAWPRPTHPQPIVIIGAGAIVRTSHLPAYARLGLPIAGFFDVDAAQARATASTVPRAVVFPTLESAAASRGAVFDVAVPGDQVVGILERLPEGAPVLIPEMSRWAPTSPKRIAVSLAAADRRLIAAMNFQLRFAPGMLALHDLVVTGDLGRVVDVDVRVVIEQPWDNWTFMVGAPRVEIVYHSIHYIDAIRWLAGEPAGVYCTGRRPSGDTQLTDTRDSIVLDYGDACAARSCSITRTRRTRPDGEHRKIMDLRGRRAIARVTWGVNHGLPVGPTRHDAGDRRIDAGHDVPLRGSWFIEAFEGPMSNLQQFIAGEDAALVSSVEDAIKTMAVVEACYRSSEGGATPIP